MRPWPPPQRGRRNRPRLLGEALAELDATLYEEQQNVLAAWLAVLPGGNRNQFRSQYLSNRNYADMSLLFSTAQGEPRNAHLSAEYLAALETRQRTPYYLNLHYQEKQMFL